MGAVTLVSPVLLDVPLVQIEVDVAGEGHQSSDDESGLFYGINSAGVCSTERRNETNHQGLRQVSPA